MSTLQRLLDDGSRFDCEYGNTLSNHLPMALVALARLGADDSRLDAFAAGYVKRRSLRPAPAREAWNPGLAWTPRLGQPAAWTVYRDLFAQWLVHDGAAEMLSQTLPALMPGCAASAFHGLIRTAYGLQTGHAAEIADGLAYWAATHQRLGDWPESLSTTTTDDPIHLLRSMAAGASRAGLISQRMADAARDGKVNTIAARLVIDEDTSRKLTRAAALAYAESGDFTALHLVTACHAMRIVAGLVDANEQTTCWRWFWQAYAHGVVAAALKPSPGPEAWAWPAVIKAAIDSEDEHVIKLVDSCREHERALGESGDALWRRAATRAVARP
jgi:Questin oxidase-like